MAVSLMTLVRDVQDSIYSFGQVKDRLIFLNADMAAVDTTFVTSTDNEARQIQPGQLLQFSSEDSVATEMVRVRTVDTSTNTVTVRRGISGTTAVLWQSATAEIRIDTEFPVHNIIQEINKEITGLPPHIWSYATSTTTVNSDWRQGYTLPAAAVGVVMVEYLPSGSTNAWERCRRYSFDPVNKVVSIHGLIEPGRDLKITYRAYPTEITGDDTLATAGLEDSLAELIQMGATYRLVAKRAPGRLVDTRAETPLNQQYRHADPVNGAVRQLYAMYKERLSAERERQRLLWPVHFNYTF